jgi:hypothetical protein
MQKKNYSTMVSRLWEEQVLQIKKLCLLPEYFNYPIPIAKKYTQAQ